MSQLAGGYGGTAWTGPSGRSLRGAGCAAPRCGTCSPTWVPRRWPTPIFARAVGTMEPFYPLRALVCASCLLVQLEEFQTPAKIFSDYAYFSSYSTSGSSTAAATASGWSSCSTWGASQVVEIASNDGYLLQDFQGAACPCSASSPRPTWRRRRCEKGIPTGVEFFGRATALGRWPRLPRRSAGGQQRPRARPRPGRFRRWMKILLAPGGTITMEFPHLMRLIEDDQWDTIYHEHFSYSPSSPRPGIRRPRAAPVRRGGVADARRLAARVRGARGRRCQPDTRRARSCASASVRPGTSAWRPTPIMAPGSRPTSAGSSSS